MRRITLFFYYWTFPVVDVEGRKRWSNMRMAWEMATIIASALAKGSAGKRN